MRKVFLAGVVLVSSLCGCATHPPIAGTDDDWVTLPPATGSNVPRRVRRSELAAQNGAGSNLDVISGQALMQNVRPNAPPPNVRGP